jgi:regulator of protease activity HflC (stomatin/prohibitin superfamily)
MKKSEKIGIGALILAILLSILLYNCIERIDAGYAGVVYNATGGVESKALSQGWHIVSPTKKIIEYPVSTETVYLSKDKKEGSKDDDSFFISTKDGKTVNVDVAYSYRMDYNKLPNIFTKFRGRSDNEIENGFMRDRLKESCNFVSTTMDVQGVYGEKRQELTNKVYQRFAKQLKDIGIVVENLSFTRIEPDENSMKAIQAKVDAKQKLDRMKVEKQQAEIAAEKLMIEAQGKAQAKVVEAEGQAEANRLLERSLTDNVIKQQWIDKWDSHLPQVSSDSGIIISLK